MATAQAHSDFLPPPSPGSGRALVLALIVHGLLVLALAYAVPWHLQTPSATFSAELWAPLPIEAAPPALLPEPPAPEVESTVAPPAPTPEPARTAPPPSPAKDADIATAERKAQQKKQDDRKAAQEKKNWKAPSGTSASAQRKENPQRGKNQTQPSRRIKRRRIGAAKAQEASAKRNKSPKSLKELEIAKQPEVERLREEQAQSEKLRKDAKERALRLAGAAAGSGNANASGSAAQSAGPSAGYGAKVVAAIRHNISSNKDLSASLTAEYDVYTDASGRVISAKLRNAAAMRIGTRPRQCDFENRAAAVRNTHPPLTISLRAG